MDLTNAEDEDIDSSLSEQYSQSLYTQRGPTFWREGLAECFYLTRISTDKAGANYSSLLLVTKDKPLPKMPTMDFWHHDVPFHMTCVNIGHALPLSMVDRDVLQKFTDRLLKVMINKVFIAPSESHVSMLILLAK